jgi:drug/metabolite transporter (DMT)-like permease
MKTDALKGSVLVALGACCYGMLGIYVKMAYSDGFTTAEVTIAQFALGFIGLLVPNLLPKQKPSTGTANIKSKLRLMAAGTSLGLTSIFYYLSVSYIAVSIAIVLLIQAVWIGVVLEMIIHKKLPETRKIVSAGIVITGTILATNLYGHSVSVNWPGLTFGILSAFCYAATMYSSNTLELHLPPLTRSLYMIAGGLVIIVVVFHSSINADFSYMIFVRWGLLVSLFGTILPPLLFTRGMPLTGMGLGAIIASIEIPIAVIMANLLLNEPVLPLQWIGVGLILVAVVVMNWFDGMMSFGRGGTC